MRWRLFKEALGLAKDVYGRKDVWVDFPPRLRSSGEIDVFCQDDCDLVDAIHYQSRPVGSKLVVRFVLGDKTKEVTLPKRKRMRIRKRIQKEDLRPILMDHGEAGFRILADAARTMFTSKESMSKWAKDGGLTQQEADKIVSLAQPAPRKDDDEIKPSERVRIVGPCMDFGELAWVVGIRETRKAPLYEVLVDGSSEAIFVPREWIQKNMAGVVSDA